MPQRTECIGATLYRIEPRLLEAYRDRVSILAQKMKPISLPSYCAMPPPEYDGHRSTAASSEAALPSQALKASNQLNGSAFWRERTIRCWFRV
jgi:hypothetical protein